jgi:hypothetical protein
MTSKAEIEAQIESLKRKLKESEMDADFTPMELVRWDPSLLGTVLHLKYHNEHIIRKSLRYVWCFGGEHWIVNYNPPIGCKIGTNIKSNHIEEQPLHKIGVLSNKGLISPNEEYNGLVHTYDGYKELSNHNTFESLLEMSVWITQYRGAEADFRSEFKEHGNRLPGAQWVKQIKLDTTHFKIQHYTNPANNYKSYWVDIKLTKPDDNLLDKIHIVKVVKLPFQDKEVIIDLYPLSKLYKEWKADKDAKRPVRLGVKWHGIRPEWAGDETLTWKQITDVKRNCCSTAEKKVDKHIQSCDCTMCAVTKDHP